MNEAEHKAEIDRLEAKGRLMIEDDLRTRLCRAAPKDRVVLEDIARLAFGLQESTWRVRSPDCSEMQAAQHLNATNIMSRALHLLGPDIVDGSLAKKIHDEAMGPYLAIEQIANGVSGSA
jgi:hypothetical protein